MNYKILKSQLWSEFTPVLYNLSVDLKGNDGQIIDRKSVEFGMREFKANGTRFDGQWKTSISERDNGMLYISPDRLSTFGCTVMGKSFADMQRIWPEPCTVSILLVRLKRHLQQQISSGYIFI